MRSLRILIAFAGCVISLAQSVHAGGIRVIHPGDVHEFVTPCPPTLPAASRQFHCFATDRPRVRGSIGVWTDKRMELMAIASGEPGTPLPAATAGMIKQSVGTSHDAIRAAMGGRVVSARSHPRFTLAAAGMRWTCMPDHDD